MVKFAGSCAKFVRPSLLFSTMLLACAWQAQAVHFTLVSAGPSTWTYTLTFDPEDNYNITTSPTTITLTGLNGVTAAGAPTSTDFPAGPLDTNNLAWTPQVLNGGTKVVWSNSIGGTGNFSTAKHVFGFTVTAPGIPNGTVSFVTSGMTQEPSLNVDVSGSVAGPSTTTGAAAVPAVSPFGLLCMCLGLALVGGYQLRHRFLDRLRNGE